MELIIHKRGDLASWIVPYAEIKPVNVFGALEVLRLACRKRVKAAHFVSYHRRVPGAISRRTQRTHAGR
ncbi:thioester reductase domain-containing protein [Streptomyces tanashiensis]